MRYEADSETDFEFPTKKWNIARDWIILPPPLVCMQGAEVNEVEWSYNPLKSPYRVDPKRPLQFKKTFELSSAEKTWDIEFGPLNNSLTLQIGANWVCENRERKAHLLMSLTTPVSFSQEIWSQKMFDTKIDLCTIIHNCGQLSSLSMHQLRSQLS